MIDILNIILGVSFLGVISFIDILTFNKKNGYIPSMLTTTFLIFALLIGGKEALYSGVLASLLALLLTDLDFWGGIADFKVFVAAGLLFTNFFEMTIFAGGVTIFGFMYKTVALKILKDPKANIPFIPVILISFIITSWVFFG